MNTSTALIAGFLIGFVAGAWVTFKFVLPAYAKIQGALKALREVPK